MQFPDIKGAFLKLLESVKTVLFGLLLPLQIFLNVVVMFALCTAYAIVNPVWKLANKYLPQGTITATLYSWKKKLEVRVSPQDDNV